MTIKEVNAIFQKKYPQGKVYQRGAFAGCEYRVSVQFYTNGKVYDYTGQNYVEVLNKLNIPALYFSQAKNLQDEIESLEKIIKDGGEHINDEFGFFESEFISLTNEKRVQYLQMIKENKEILQKSIIVNK